MDLSTLNEYSARVARLILAARPEWAAHAVAEDGVLVLRVPCPIANRPELIVYTDRDEITVSYDRWHGHFDKWEDPAAERLSDDAFACAAAILSELVRVAVHMTGNDWSGSGLLYRDEAVPEPGPGQHVYVRSWLGTYDTVRHAS